MHMYMYIPTCNIVVGKAAATSVSAVFEESESNPIFRRFVSLSLDCAFSKKNRDHRPMASTQCTQYAKDYFRKERRLKRLRKHVQHNIGGMRPGCLRVYPMD